MKNLFCIKGLLIFFGILLIASPIHAQSRDQEIIEQIKISGPGIRFVISQIQPIKGQNWGGYIPITFSGSTIEGDISWGPGGMVAGGNKTVLSFTDKIDFFGDTVFLGQNKVFLPQNIRGFIFESQPDNPLTFLLLEKYGLVYISGNGNVTFPDGKRVKLPQKNVVSLEPIDTSKIKRNDTSLKNVDFYIDPKELQILTKALKEKDGVFTAFIVDKIPEDGKFSTSDLNKMSSFVSRSNNHTKVTIKNGNVTLEFPGDKMLLSQLDFTPYIWHVGATIRFADEFKLEGYTIIGEGDQSNRLTFKIDESANFKYLSGKGRIILKDGKEIKLGY